MLRCLRVATSRKYNIAFTFDLDGVLMHDVGGRAVAIPQARESLQLLDHLLVPYVFLTNSGGSKETSKAAAIGEPLQLPIDPRRMIMCHTPLSGDGDFVHLRHQPVLACGPPAKSTEALMSYGFTHVDTPMGIAVHDCKHFPLAHRDVSLDLSSPRRVVPPASTPIQYAPHHYDGVIVMNDSIDIGVDIQAISDTLLAPRSPSCPSAHDRPLGHYARETLAVLSPSGPYRRAVVFCQDDLVFGNGSFLPRLGIATLRLALLAALRAYPPSIVPSPSLVAAVRAALAYTPEQRSLLRAVAATHHGGVSRCGPYGVPSDVLLARADAADRVAAAVESSQVDMCDDDVVAQFAAGLNMNVLECVSMLWAFAIMGKPQRIAYDHSLATLRSLSKSGSTSFDAVWMVGDNPASDILGANDAGNPWRSALVATGVVSRAEVEALRRSPVVHPSHPKQAFDDVAQAVVNILAQAARRSPNSDIARRFREVESDSGFLGSFVRSTIFGEARR